MAIVVCGINHKTAPIALRERVVFAPEKLALYLQDLVQNENIREAVLLSTCNRSELYCNSNDKNKIINWFCSQHKISENELASALYFYQDETAVEHIMRVACGLDSMVVGESQILGQMKEAFTESCAAGSVDTLFNRLFQQVFAVAKEVRTNTALGACPVSVSSAAVNFIKQIIPLPIASARVIVIGAGLTMDLVLRHLMPCQPKQLLIVNRSIDNAIELAKKFAVQAVALQELAINLPEADIVISAIGGTLPVIQTAMLVARQKPLYIMDIGVPRNIDPLVKEIENIFLYSIDDLQTIIQKNLRGREHAVEKAEEVIKQKSQEFISWLKSLDLVTTTIRAYRKHIEDLCDAELSKSMKYLQRGDEPSQVLAHFAYTLVQKLLHAPSVQLRQAGFEGRFEILQLAQQLFSIEAMPNES